MVYVILVLAWLLALPACISASSSDGTCLGNDCAELEVSLLQTSLITKQKGSSFNIDGDLDVLNKTAKANIVIVNNCTIKKQTIDDAPETAENDGMEFFTCTTGGNTTWFIAYDTQSENDLANIGGTYTVKLKEITAPRHPSQGYSYPWEASSSGFYKLLTQETILLMSVEEIANRNRVKHGINTLGTNKEMDILVIFCDYADHKVSYITEDQVRLDLVGKPAEFRNFSASMNHLISTASNGAFKVAREKLKIVRVDMGENWAGISGCPYTDISRHARAAAHAQHKIDPEQFTFRAYYMPHTATATGGCNWAGLADHGCAPPWLIPNPGMCDSWHTSSAHSLLSHELGHNLGLHHAGGQATTGAWLESADPQALMGDSSEMSSFTAGALDQLELLNSDSVLDVSLDNINTFVDIKSLSLHDKLATNTVAVKIPCSVCVPKVAAHSANVGGHIYVSFRGDEHMGFGDKSQNKVYVHLQRRYTQKHWGQGSELWARMNEGMSYQPTGLPLQISVCSIRSDYATVYIGSPGDNKCENKPYVFHHAGQACVPDDHIVLGTTAKLFSLQKETLPEDCYKRCVKWGRSKGKTCTAFDTRKGCFGYYTPLVEVGGDILTGSGYGDCYALQACSPLHITGYCSPGSTCVSGVCQEGSSINLLRTDTIIVNGCTVKKQIVDDAPETAVNDGIEFFTCTKDDETHFIRSDTQSERVLANIGGTYSLKLKEITAPTHPARTDQQLARGEGYAYPWETYPPSPFYELQHLDASLLMSAEEIAKRNRNKYGMNTSGTKKEMDILIIFVDYLDNGIDYITEDKAKLDLIGRPEQFDEVGEYRFPGSMADLISKASDGTLTVATKKLQVVRASMGTNWNSIENCPYWEITQAAVNAVKAQHEIDPATFTYRMFYLPQHGHSGGCTWAGLADHGCAPPWTIPNPGMCDSWFTTSMPSLLAHELGHNLGLLHAGGKTRLGAWTEYGDPQALMGGEDEMSSFTAPALDQLELLTSYSVLQFNSTSQFVDIKSLTLYNRASMNIVAVKIPCSVCVPKVPSRSDLIGGAIYVYFRGDESYSDIKYQGLELKYKNRVYVHLQRHYNVKQWGEGTELWARLTEGESYRPTGLDWEISVCDVEGDYAKIYIGLPGYRKCEDTRPFTIFKPGQECAPPGQITIGQNLGHSEDNLPKDCYKECVRFGREFGRTCTAFDTRKGCFGYYDVRVATGGNMLTGDNYGDCFALKACSSHYPTGYCNVHGETCVSGVCKVINCKVPQVDFGNGTRRKLAWSGLHCEEGSTSVTPPENCTVSAEGYMCSSPGVCGVDGRFENESPSCKEWPCTVASLAACKTCVEPSKRRHINHCASCHEGFKLSDGSCQAPTTVTTERATAGTRTLPVKCTAGFTLGGHILIHSGAGSESNIVEGKGTSIILKYPLVYTHSSGTQVMELPTEDPKIKAATKASTAFTFSGQVKRGDITLPDWASPLSVAQYFQHFAGQFICSICESNMMKSDGCRMDTVDDVPTPMGCDSCKEWLRDSCAKSLANDAANAAKSNRTAIKN